MPWLIEGLFAAPCLQNMYGSKYTWRGFFVCCILVYLKMFIFSKKMQWYMQRISACIATTLL